MKIDKDSAMLVDIQYIKERKSENTPDILYIIWKDLDTGKKFMQPVKNPAMDIYFEKPEFREHQYNKNCAKIETLNKVTVKAKDIIYAIADDMGEYGQQLLNTCFATRDYKRLREFYLYPHVYGADYDVRVWYRYKWLQSFDNDRIKELTKGYLDIETDFIEANGFPNAASDPIDLVTIIYDNDVYTFILTGREYKEINFHGLSKKEIEWEMEKKKLYDKRHEQEEYYYNNQDILYKEIHDKFDESYPNMNYHVYFYNDELKMITHLFQLINTLKLDFIEIWNMRFDIPYIYDRLVALGEDPKEIMCHPDFPIKECYFKDDKINFAVKNRSDYFKCSSYTIFTDQMRNYAAIRKGQQELRSTKLTYIAKREIGDEKLDYSDDGELKTLGYRNWLLYVLYNIKDVLLQKGIEERTTDLDTYYITSYQNITPYENEFKQTVKLRNVQYLFYLNKGLVPGENVNGILYNSEKEKDDDDEDDVGFEGALVGNPALIDNFGVELFGKKTNNIFRYNVDFDMSAFYPSTINAMNIDPSSLIFKMFLNADNYDVRGGDIPFNGITDVQACEDNSDTFIGDVAKECMDNFQTRDYITTGNKWLNLPSVNDVYTELVERYGGKNG